MTGFLSSGTYNLGLNCHQWMAVPGRNSQKARIGTETSRDVSSDGQRLETEGPGMVRMKNKNRAQQTGSPSLSNYSLCRSRISVHRFW